MGSRRKARELAMQFLYSFEINPGDISTQLENFWEMNPTDDGSKQFSSSLISGAIEKKAEIDEIIAKFAINWDIDRIALVDKTILRIAIFEMLYRDDIPPVVSINEAVDIAKKYSTSESGKFVNGILDKVKIEVLKQ